MKELDASVRKIKRGMDDSFRMTRSDGTTYVNYTCGTGKMVTVDYFALRDLLDFYKETKDAVNKVLIARELLRLVHWGMEPKDKEKTIAAIKAEQE